ncbi:MULTISPECIES: hypothetical protein [unclassified Pseudomonas]|jgi:hypothetical protein|uniref:hypothetical protein n=1 Tax=unclassified Pseudomonas TaxID=196821 RepID=UPI000F55A206|nr:MULTISPECIES: hypothetical protein [unclassified Pseudomonas]AZF24533.1 hypothetical protein C4J90_0329 [Pseudomonas sp. R2-60-08W]MDO4237719.1 hypothetical protein [Pseudomonas sp.]
MINENIFELCSTILTKLGFGNETFNSLVQRWDFFVDECQDGYRWDYSEYRNEIRVRGLLEQLLNSSAISSSENFKELREKVISVDKKFKDLLQPGIALVEGEGWWDSGVLMYAGEDYSCYMKEAHGVLVEVVES